MAEAKDIIQRFEQLRGRRGTWEAEWQLLAEFVLPTRGDFNRRTLTRGERRGEKAFDSTARLANAELAAGLHTMLTSPAMRWFSLRAKDESLNERDDVKRWLEDATDRLYTIFSGADAGFNPAAHELYLDLGAFGTGIMFVGERSGRGITFQARHLGECHIAENDIGVVDTLYREFRLTHRQAVQRWGMNTPEQIRAKVEQSPLEESCFIHAVYPREDYKGGDRRLSRNAPWVSCYVSRDYNQKISEGGFHEFPYLVPRWSKLTGETYGRSPGMTALPSILQANGMAKTVLVGAQLAVAPPLQAPDDGFMLPIRTAPNSVNFYRAGSPQYDRISPILTGVRPDIGVDMLGMVRSDIERAFFVQWLRILQDPNASRMTATQVLQLRDQFFQIMGPALARLQAEFLGPLISRTFGIMLRNRMLPPPPPEIFDAELDVDYVSPIAQAQRATKVESMARVIEMTRVLAETDPVLASIIDGDAAVREVADVYNAPLDMLRSPDDMAALRQQQAEANAAMMQQEQAMVGAAVVKDLATAEKASNAVR